MFADGAQASSKAAGELDKNSASDKWFHKHFAEDDQNKICVWLIMYDC